MWSHTLVRNGEPFIKPVLEQVLPFVDKMLITISQKSTDQTNEVIHTLAYANPEKIIIEVEDVEKPSDLTFYRQKQVDRTPDGEWVLFLDSNDWWTTEALKNITHLAKNNKYFDAFAFVPYQVIDKQYHDTEWGNRWFTKLFKKEKDVFYIKPWPRDVLVKGDKMLYWKLNNRVKKVPIRYYHLDNLMPWRFRDQEWAQKYQTIIGKRRKFGLKARKELEAIYTFI